MVKEAVIVAATRTAVGKAPRGMLRTTRPDDMAAAAITARHGTRSQGKLDTGRDRGCGAGLRHPGRGAGLQHGARRGAARRACRTVWRAQRSTASARPGLQTIAQSAERIMAGFGTAIVAGGAESMSLVQLAGYGSRRTRAGRDAPRPLSGHGPDRRECGEASGRSAARTRMRLRSARTSAPPPRSTAGKFRDEIVPLPVKITYVDEGGKVRTQRRRRSTPTKARAATPRPKRWRSCSRSSPRAAA